MKRPGKRQHIRDLAGRNIPPSPPRAQRVQLTTAAELGQRLIPCPQTWGSDRPGREQHQKQTRGPHRVTYPGHCGPIHPSSRVYRYIPAPHLKHWQAWYVGSHTGSLISLTLMALYVLRYWLFKIKLGIVRQHLILTNIKFIVFLDRRGKYLHRKIV